jgi:hypothetical protein
VPASPTALQKEGKTSHPNLLDERCTRTAGPLRPQRRTRGDRGRRPDSKESRLPITLGILTTLEGGANQRRILLDLRLDRRSIQVYRTRTMRTEQEAQTRGQAPCYPGKPPSEANLTRSTTPIWPTA